MEEVRSIMRNLKFNVSGQMMSPDQFCDFAGLVPGTEGYLQAEFSFSEEWNGCGKIAEFRRFSTSEPVSVKLVGDACVIPPEALIGRSFKVSVIGIRKGFRIQTNMVEVKQNG